MGKLHELLAVESNVQTQANKTRTELMATFDKKRHLFEEKRKTYTAGEEGAQPVTEEQQDIQSSIVSEIAWISKILAKAFDIGHQIDMGNTKASADVIVEEHELPLLKSIPTTSLLRLEHRVDELRALITSIPTLDPAKGFRPDPEKGKYVFKAREIVKDRTKKMPKVITLHPPTREHPAQTQLIQEDVPVGKILEQEWSALIHPATKADILDRVDKLARAIKRARSKANDVEVETGERIGRRLLEYVFEPLHKPGDAGAAT